MPPSTKAGYQPSAPGDCQRRYTRGPASVEVDFAALTTHELVLWFDDGRRPDEPPVGLADMLRAVGHEHELLDPDLSFFGRARAQRSQRGRELMATDRARQMYAAADPAWSRKNFAETRRLLESVEEGLDPAHRRRLQFLRQRT